MLALFPPRLVPLVGGVIPLRAKIGRAQIVNTNNWTNPTIKASTNPDTTAVTSSCCWCFNTFVCSFDVVLAWFIIFVVDTCPALEAISEMEVLDSGDVYSLLTADYSYQIQRVIAICWTLISHICHLEKHLQWENSGEYPKRTWLARAMPIAPKMFGSCNWEYSNAPFIKSANGTIACCKNDATINE